MLLKLSISRATCSKAPAAAKSHHSTANWKKNAMGSSCKGPAKLGDWGRSQDVPCQEQVTSSNGKSQGNRREGAQTKRNYF